LLLSEEVRVVVGVAIRANILARPGIVIIARIPYVRSVHPATGFHRQIFEIFEANFLEHIEFVLSLPATTCWVVIVNEICEGLFAGHGLGLELV
jgi:hypothetical protein